MLKKLINGTTAIAIALTSTAPAFAGDLPSWSEAIANHEARIAAGKFSGHTLGKHSNAVFKSLSGADGFIFGNVLNDDTVLPRVTDVRKVIEAAKKGDKPVVVASNDWILPSNALLCAVAEQVKMTCGDFTVEFMRGSSDLTDAEFNEFLTSQSAQLKEIAKMIGAVSPGKSALVKLLEDYGKTIDVNNSVLDEVKHLLEDEIDLEILEVALQNWDATVAAMRAGELEGHITVYAEIMAGIQDEVDFLAAERERLQGELTVAKAEIVRQDGVIAGLESSLASTQAALASTQSALSASEATNADLSAQVSNLTGSLAAANSSIDGLNTEIATLEAKLAAKQAQINSLISQRNGLQSDLNAANTEANRLQNQINGTEVEDGHRSTVVINSDGSVTVTGANAGTYASQVVNNVTEVVGGDTITYTSYSAYLQDEWFTVNSEDSLRAALVAAKQKGSDAGVAYAIDKIGAVIGYKGTEIYGDTGIRKAIQDAIAAARVPAADAVTFKEVSIDKDITNDEYVAADHSWALGDERNSITIELTDGTTKTYAFSTWDSSNIIKVVKVVTDGVDVDMGAARSISENGTYKLVANNGRVTTFTVNVDTPAAPVVTGFSALEVRTELTGQYGTLYAGTYDSSVKTAVSIAGTGTDNNPFTVTVDATNVYNLGVSNGRDEAMDDIVDIVDDIIADTFYVNAFSANSPYSSDEITIGLKITAYGTTVSQSTTTANLSLIQQTHDAAIANGYDGTYEAGGFAGNPNLANTTIGAEVATAIEAAYTAGAASVTPEGLGAAAMQTLSSLTKLIQNADPVAAYSGTADENASGGTYDWDVNASSGTIDNKDIHDNLDIEINGTTIETDLAIKIATGSGVGTWEVLSNWEFYSVFNVGTLADLMVDAYDVGYDDGYNAGYTQGYADGVAYVQGAILD